MMPNAWEKEWVEGAGHSGGWRPSLQKERQGTQSSWGGELGSQDCTFSPTLRKPELFIPKV